MTPLQEPFDLNLATLLARCCVRAYRARAGDEFADGAVRNVSPCGFACMISTDMGRVLAFRGTDNLTDWIKDLECLLWPSPWGDGRVHAGFYDRFRQIRPWLDLIRRPDFITGHSLGGAVATHAAAFYFQKGWARTTYTFGAPRIGDGDFAACFKPNLYRVVNDVDVVPQVPLAFGYHHVGQPIWLSAGKLRHGMPPLEAIKSWMWRVKEFGIFSTVARQLEEHAANNGVNGYVEALDSLRGPAEYGKAA